MAIGRFKKGSEYYDIDTSGVYDSSKEQSQAAINQALSNGVDDLNSAIANTEAKLQKEVENSAGVTFATFQPGAIATGAVGSICDFTPDTSSATKQKFRCAVMPVIPGQQIMYFMSSGTSSYRTWAFTDKDQKILVRGTSGEAGKHTLTAVLGSAYLVLNSYIETYDGLGIWAISFPVDHLPWRGLRVSLLGDSISALEGYIPSGNTPYYGPTRGTEYQRSITNPEDMWWYQLIVALGGTPLIIDAWNGSSVAQGGGDAGTVEMSATSRCQNLHAWVQTSSDDPDGVEVTAENIGAMRTSPFLPAYTPAVGDFVKRINPDIVLSTGGTNDWTYANTAESIGTYDGHTALPNPDGDAPAVTTFREAYATMLCRIQKEYPFALIICGTGWFTCRPYTPKYQGNKNVDSGLTIQDYAKAVREIAVIRACAVVDFWTSGFNKYNYYPTFAADRSTSTTHPNKLGHQIIARCAIPVCREICAGYTEWLRTGYDV